MTNKRSVCALSAILFATLWTPAVLAEKTDIVVLINGDEVTGEVKGLDFGALEYSTDSMGTVNIDWEDIVSVTSNQSLQVEVSNGARYFGTLIIAADTDHIAVVRAGGITELNKNNVVRIVPIDVDDRFIDRLEGSVSAGFNTGKASGVSQGNLNGSVRYRSRDYLVGLTTNTTITDQEEQETTKRANLTLNYQRFRDNRWYTDWSGTYETNEELGINSRFSLGGGLGRFLVQTNKNQFSILAGLVATKESFVGEDDGATNAEGKLSIRYLRRTLKPQSDISFSTDIFPLLEDFSQFRAESDLTLRREMIEDLFIDLSMYHSYISDPPTDAEKEDYGIITSIGYSF